MQGSERPIYPLFFPGPASLSRKEKIKLNKKGDIK
jgi:hypothetical protein